MAKEKNFDMKAEYAPDGTQIRYENSDILTRPFRVNYPELAKKDDDAKSKKAKSKT